MYNVQIIQDTHTLYAMYGVCTVFALYIVDVQQKTIKLTEIIDHSFERKFYGACTMD